MEKDCLLVLNAAESRVQLILARVEGGFAPEAAFSHEKADGTLPAGSQAGEAEGGASSRAELLCFQEWEAPSRGTEILPAALEHAFRALEIPMVSLGRIACVQGPGSFTGLRLVLSLGAALRRATGADLAGINYMQALALGPCAEGAAFVRVLTHARRGLVHVQDFSRGAEGLPVAQGKAEVRSLEGALQGLERAAGSLCVLGSGLTRNASALLPSLPAGCRAVVEQGDHPCRRALIRLALEAEAGQRDLDPLYLRPCDAVDNLPHIARRRGQDPKEADARLLQLLRMSPKPLEE
ncbi:MAG: tRNA (adenosine(37)-N6)-threonylcarbamoyltransferase complex dimerization subunit type 1 TsaB [Desulfovibrionaceae bacterium]|nr:tRNA (adenosine(37)-N6)-threonylcarbamoyltransferase complex dimerization subunit type 1 TsaB [Desulfovibrionaceae bacterium]